MNYSYIYSACTYDIYPYHGMHTYHQQHFTTLKLNTCRLRFMYMCFLSVACIGKRPTRNRQGIQGSLQRLVFFVKIYQIIAIEHTPICLRIYRCKCLHVCVSGIASACSNCLWIVCILHIYNGKFTVFTVIFTIWAFRPPQHLVVCVCMYIGAIVTWQCHCPCRSTAATHFGVEVRVNCLTEAKWSASDLKTNLLRPTICCYCISNLCIAYSTCSHK